MRIRRLLKKALKPFLMVGIVGTLSVSLIVTTPSNAQAFVPPPVLPVIAGAAEVAGVGLAITPVGWGIIGVTALGVGLYATKDYWLPYVTGLFGAKEQNITSNPGGGAQTRHFITKTPLLSADKRTLSVSYADNNRYNQDWYAKFSVVGHCKSPTTGQTGYRHTGGYIPVRAGDQFGYGFNASPCPIGFEVIGWVAGGGNGSQVGLWTPNLDTSDPQPAQLNNVSDQYTYATSNIYWGGDMGKPEFDPKSPDMKYRVEVECISDTGVKSFANGYSNGSMAGVTFPSCAAQGKGHATGNIKIFATPPGTTTEQPTPIWSVTPKAPDPATPLCDSTRPGSGCKLAVQLDGQPCTMGLFACEHWSEVSKNPDWTPRFSCQFGPYTVPLSTCNPLERAYEPGGVPATEKNTDGDPSTRDDTQPDGSTVPKTGPITGTVPGGAGSPAPGPAPGGSPEATAQECWPTGWSVLNPFEWVLKPVGCALDAAFKPKKDLQSRLQGMQGKFSNKVPVSWFGVGIGGAAAGGCPTDWAVTFDDHRYSLICGTEADNIIRGFRPVLGGMLVMAMLWPFIRSLFYAAIPVFKVTPS